MLKTNVFFSVSIDRLKELTKGKVAIDINLISKRGVFQDRRSVKKRNSTSNVVLSQKDPLA